MKGNRISIEA